jgi:virulence-associated protein VagC
MSRPMPHADAASGRRVKLFKNGRNQAVRIPREFELPGSDAIIRKEGERLVIEPAPHQHRSLAFLWYLHTMLVKPKLRHGFRLSSLVNID